MIIGGVGAVTNVEGRDGAFSRPALAITTAMYGRAAPRTRATIATCRSTFHRQTARITEAVRIDIEMMYRRCRPRTSSWRPVRAPVIRNTSALPPALCFRICFHHPPASDSPRPALVRDRSGTPEIGRAHV